MAVVRLHATGAAGYGGNIVDPHSVTGGGSWDDNSDSSYVDVYTSHDSAITLSTYVDEGRSALDTLTLPSGSTVNSITVNYRVDTIISSPSTPLHIYVTLRDVTDTDFVELVDPGGYDVVIATVPTSYTHLIATDDLTYSGTTISAIVSNLSNGGKYGQVHAVGSNPYPTTMHYGVRIFEFSVDVDYTASGSTPVPLFSDTPPLRIHPRDDGLGTSTAGRVYPPSKSIQASNRIVGGYL